MFANLREKTLASMVVLIPLLTGCGGEQTESTEINRLKPIAILYGRFLAQNRGRPPANQEQFRKFIDTRGSDLMSQFGITDSDSLLVSSRDEQPFVIMYGRIPTSRIIAYENQGVDGKRWVANDVGHVEEMSKENLSKLVPDFKGN